MGYQIKITDSSNQMIGEMMTADKSDILKFLNKGMKVIDVQTNKEFNKDEIIMECGISDGLVEC